MPEGNGAKWWQTWLPVVAAGVMVVVYAGNYFGQKGADAKTLGDLQSKMESLELRVDRSDGDMRRLQIAQSANCQIFAKIETQFGTVESLINKNGVQFERFREEINSKVFQIPPPGIYDHELIPHEIMPCG